MSIFTRRPMALGLAIAGVAVLLLPLSYLAGWLGDLAQVKPELMALAKTRQYQNALQSRLPSEPPSLIPSPHVEWGDVSVTLAWTRIPGATNYTIYRAGSSSPFSNATTIAQVTQKGKTINYTDTTVSPGTRYTYWVAANNGAGEGAPSSPLSVRTYLSWNTIATQAESAAQLGTLTAWSKTAWGILGQTSQSTTFPMWNIAGQVVTPQTANQQHSNWLVQQGLSWTSGSRPLSASPKGHLTQLLGQQNLTVIPTGHPTAEDLALWRANGHWADAIVTPSAITLPSDALVLNQYGQAIGLTDSSGQMVAL